jgi:hypothetical protein
MQSGENLTLIANNHSLIIEQLIRRLGREKLIDRIIQEPAQVSVIVTPFVSFNTALLINQSLHKFMMKNRDVFI